MKSWKTVSYPKLPVELPSSGKFFSKIGYNILLNLIIATPIILLSGGISFSFRMFLTYMRPYIYSK